VWENWGAIQTKKKKKGVRQHIFFTFFSFWVFIIDFALNMLKHHLFFNKTHQKRVTLVLLR